MIKNFIQSVNHATFFKSIIKQAPNKILNFTSLEITQ
jgi:hypothetical protein